MKAVVGIVRECIARLREVPLVVATTIFMAGILFFDRFEAGAPLLWTLFAAALVFAFAAMRSHESAAVAALCATFFLLGGVAWNIRDLRSDNGDIPVDVPLLVDLEVLDVPAERSGGRTFVPVRIAGYDDGSVRRTTKSKAMMWSDSTLRLAFGDRVTAFVPVRRFRDLRSGYARQMDRRGFAGTLFVTASDTVSVERGAGGRTLHRLAVERFARLELEPQVAAVAGSMGAGDRNRMTPELREAYALSGVSHILAVSGLHIGIVFLLATLLLRPLAILRHGQIIADVAVLVPVWLYAAAAGFPPSVLRAAVMFGVLQLSRACTASRSSLSSLAFAAFAMTLFEPETIFDAGFQLSFVAVAAIVTLGQPLYDLTARRRPWVRLLCDTMVTGVIAFLATAPLNMHLFGRISMAGIIVNTFVIMCAYVVVAVSVLWIMVPAGFLQPAVEWVLNFTVGLQNRVVGTTASWRSLVVDAELSEGAVIAVYAVLALAVVVLSVNGKRRIAG